MGALTGRPMLLASWIWQSSVKGPVRGLCGGYLNAGLSASIRRKRIFYSTWDVLPGLLGPQNIGTLTSLHICKPQNGAQASDPDPARFLPRVYVSVLFSAVWLKEPRPGGGMGLRAE